MAIRFFSNLIGPTCQNRTRGTSVYGEVFALEWGGYTLSGIYYDYWIRYNHLDKWSSHILS